MVSIGLLLLVCTWPWAARIIDGREPGYPVALIGPALLVGLAGMFFWTVWRPGVSLYDDRLVVVTTRRASFPRHDTTTIWFRDIEAYWTGLASGRDVLLIALRTGESVTVDVETYPQARVERVVWELVTCTNIAPEGWVTPREHSDPAWMRVAKAVVGLLAVVTVVFAVPIATIWVEAWLNPAHPPSFSSGWRVGYMLCGIFAGFGAVGWWASRARAGESANGIDLKRGYREYARLARFFGIAAAVMYAAAVVLFVASVRG